MTWTEDYEQLQNRLVQLFPQKNQQNMIAIKAGLNAGNINFEGAARDTWFEIIRHAINVEKLESLLQASLNASDDDSILIEIRIKIQREGTSVKTKDSPLKDKRDDRISKIRKMALSGHLKEAIELLVNFLENEPQLKRFLNTVYLLLSRCNQNENDRNKGITTEENYNRTRNQIIDAILSLLDQIG